MKTANLLLLFAAMHVGTVSAADTCAADTIPVMELRYPLTENDCNDSFIYLNDRYYSNGYAKDIDSHSIEKIEIKPDQYGNKAIFMTMPQAVVDSLFAAREAASRGVFGEYPYPRWEFPGGNGKLVEWLNENIRYPEGFTGSKRVMVDAKMQTDGTVVFGKIARGGENEALNKEAERLIGIMPKFRVKYYLPEKKPFNIIIPITFTAPGTVFIR